MCARLQAAALMELKGKLDAAGVALVGSGSPESAKRFIEKFNFTGEIYMNQDLGAYRAFKLKRGFWQTLGPLSLIRGIQAMRQGFGQGHTAGDLWQQGGLFVIGPGKQLLFQHRTSSPEIMQTWM